jgi:hypothetical protein
LIGGGGGALSILGRYFLWEALLLAAVFSKDFPLGPFLQRGLKLPDQLGVWCSCGRLTRVPIK